MEALVSYMFCRGMVIGNWDSRKFSSVFSEKSETSAGSVFPLSSLSSSAVLPFAHPGLVRSLVIPSLLG